MTQSKIFIITLLAFSLVSIGAMVFAQEEETNNEDWLISTNDATETAEEIALDENVTAEDLGVEEPSLLPDNSFYVFKEIGRSVQSFFTFNQTKKIELKEKFSNEKLLELKQMVEQNKSRKRIETALQNYQKELGEMEQIATRIQERTKTEASEETGKFLDKFVQQQALQQRVLQKLETQVPEEVMAKIQAAREKHLENFGQIMTKLEDANMEKIQERLGKNLQKIEGSDFKDFKNLEILDELEEKVPEAMKEAVSNVRENTLNSLKETLQSLPVLQRERFQEYIENVSGDKERQLEILDTIKQVLPTAVGNIISDSSEKILERVKEKVQLRETETNSQGACITLWKPVCGKDGRTYSNECFAELAGTEVAGEGTCGEQKREQEREMMENQGEDNIIQEQEKEMEQEGKDTTGSNVIQQIKGMFNR